MTTNDTALMFASILDQMPSNLKDDKTSDAEALRKGDGYTYKATLRSRVTMTRHGSGIEVNFRTIGYDKFERDRRYKVKTHKVGDSTIHIPSPKLWEGLAEYIQAEKAHEERKAKEDENRRKSNACRKAAWEVFKPSIPEGFVSDLSCYQEPWEGDRAILQCSPIRLTVTYNYPVTEGDNGEWAITSLNVGIANPTADDIETALLMVPTPEPVNA